MQFKASVAAGMQFGLQQLARQDDEAEDSALGLITGVDPER